VQLVGKVVVLICHLPAEHPFSTDSGSSLLSKNRSKSASCHHPSTGSASSVALVGGG